MLWMILSIFLPMIAHLLGNVEFLDLKTGNCFQSFLDAMVDFTEWLHSHSWGHALDFADRT